MTSTGQLGTGQLGTPRVLAVRAIIPSTHLDVTPSQAMREAQGATGWILATKYRSRGAWGRWILATKYRSRGAWGLTVERRLSPCSWTGQIACLF